MNRDVRSRPAGATWLTCQLHASDPRHPRPLALSFYAGPDRLIACEFGTIPERKLPEYALPIGGRLRFFLRRPRGTVIGFEVDGLHRIDVDAEQPSLWTAPRFRVPVLGLKSAVVAEILLRARVVLAGGSTPDVLAFERADECCAAGITPVPKPPCGSAPTVQVMPIAGRIAGTIDRPTPDRGS